MRCCVPACRNTAESVSEENSERITFHSFPSEAHLRAAWLRALGKQDAHLPGSAVVCSQHFLSDEMYETESGLWQVESGAIPSTVLVCMICLDTESKQFLTSKYKLEDAYAELTGHPLYDPGNLKQTLCAQCAQRLINFSTFRDRSLRARSLMMDLVEKHELITKRHIKMINRTKNQLKCNFVSTMLGPDHWDLHIVEHTAEDKQPKLEDSVERVFKTVDLKNDGYDCMLVDDNFEENNEDDNDLSNVVQREHLESDDAIILNCESATYECKLCSEVFHLEHEYNEHMSTHLQNGDGACKMSRVCDRLTAGSPGCNPPHIIDHKYAIQKLDDKSHHASPTCVAPSPARLATRYDVKQSSAEEADPSEKSERGLAVDDGDSDNQASGSDNETDTNVDDFKNCVMNLYNIFKKLKKPTSCSDSQNAVNVTDKMRNTPKTLQSETNYYSDNDIIIQIKKTSDNNSVHANTGKKCFTCDVCGKTFKQKCLLVKHIKTHSDVKRFTCKFCPYKSKYNGNLVLHTRTHTGEKPHTCKVCDYKCARSSQLGRHMRSHAGATPYCCKFCDYKCAKSSLLVKHMRTHGGDKPYSCKFCEYKCAHNANFVQHMRTHTGEKPYSCEFCEYKCAIKANLVLHIRTHTGEKPYSCTLCKYKCSQKVSLVYHMRTHTGEKPYSCGLCEYKCATSNLLRRHMKTHTRENSYFCELCAFNCAKKSQLDIHMRTHTGDKPYSCELCEFKCARKANLQRHIKTHTGEKPYSCKLCPYRCIRHSQLVDHMCNHTGVKPYACELCNYKSGQYAGLVQHMRTHSGVKPYSCDICEYRCAHKQNLRQHMRTHTGEKPFSCDLCPYKSSQRVCLVQHMRTHTGEKPYSCDLCKFTCAQKHNLVQHMQKHSATKPYACEFCGASYVRNAALVEHIRTHTGEKPYSCEICEYKCAKSSQLGKHMQTHTGEKPYFCELCAYNCATSYQLGKHMQTHND